MWQRFKEQIPAILVTVIVLGAFCAWLIQRSAMEQAAALSPLREQNDALRAQAADNQRQIEATAQILRTAVADHEGELFKTDAEIAKLNEQRIDSLATAIAEKVVPQIPGPKTPAELSQLEDEQVGRISTAVADKLQPALADLGRNQRKAGAATAKVLADDQTRIQTLNDRLQAAQGAADDALKLSHEITARYLATYNDHGVVTRILTLPAELLRDTADGSILVSANKDQVQKQLDQQMDALQKRIQAIQDSDAMADAK
jgi:hypothetical protein